jgi:hypothetical protein
MTPFTVPCGGGTPSADGTEGATRPAGSAPAKRSGRAAGRLSVQALRKRIDRGEPVTVLDVRQHEATAADPRRLPGAVIMHPDEVAERWSELPRERDVVAYCT